MFLLVHVTHMAQDDDPTGGRAQGRAVKRRTLFLPAENIMLGQDFFNNYVSRGQEQMSCILYSCSLHRGNLKAVERCDNSRNAFPPDRDFVLSKL